MELTIIKVHENKSDEMFDSENCQTLLNIYEGYYPTVGFNPPWVGYFILKDKKIVGSCGFTGKPLDGKVEIAYWTFKEFEGQGIASFACKELIAISEKTEPALLLTAKTAPEHNASTRVLQRNGFQFLEIVQDDEIGDAWLWIRSNS